MKHAVVSFLKQRVLLLKFEKTHFAQYGAQNPPPVKRNFTQMSLTSNHDDLAAFENHE